MLLHKDRPVDGWVDRWMDGWMNKGTVSRGYKVLAFIPTSVLGQEGQDQETGRHAEM